MELIREFSVATDNAMGCAFICMSSNAVVKECQYSEKNATAFD